MTWPSTAGWRPSSGRWAAAARPDRGVDSQELGGAPALDLTSIAGSEGFEGPHGGHSGGPAEVAWLDPLPILGPVSCRTEPFAAELLPEARQSVMDIADRMQCPPDFPAVAAMVGLSSVIVLGSEGLHQAQAAGQLGGHSEPVGRGRGPAGVMKSPALSEALKPLDRRRQRRTRPMPRPCRATN